MINVLHLSETPLSAAPYRLMQVQNADPEARISARLISHKNTYSDASSTTFPTDILLQDWRSNSEKKNDPCFNKAEIFELFRDADILHLHNTLEEQYVFRLFPELSKYLTKKKIIYQVHSPRNALKRVEANLKDKRVHEKLVIAQYQVRQFPECRIVPNAIPIHDNLHSPTERFTPVRVVYSPSNVVLKGWNNKGHKETLRGISRVEGPFQFQTITGLPFELCLSQKQRAHIAIDEIITGSYHMCTLEALSMGQVAIANVDEVCQDAVKSITGGEGIPVLKANPDDIHAKITGLLKDIDSLYDMQTQSRLWMEKHWNEERVTDIFMGVYA